MNPEDLRAAVLERLDRGLLDSIRAELQTNVLAALATSEVRVRSSFKRDSKLGTQHHV